MIYNRTYRMAETLLPLSQEQILNTPEFYALALDQIIGDQRCPAHLKGVLLALPWSSRANYIQVRPQDWRQGAPGSVLGGGWHVDINTNLAGGHPPKIAKNLDEFRSMVVSFGDVVETEFIRGPIEVHADPYDHCAFNDAVSKRSFATDVAAPNQIAVYTTRDIHRIAPRTRNNAARLIIVTVECDEPLPEGAGWVGSSIAQR